MKKISLISIVFAVVLFVASCGTKKDPNKTYLATATDYNNFIVGEQTKIVQKMMSLSQMAGVTTPEQMTQAQKETIAQCDTSINATKKLADFEGNVELRDGAVKLFEFYKSIISNEYAQMMTIVQKGAAITPDDTTQLGKIQRSIAEKEKSFDQTFQSAQKAFAEKNKMKIEENQLQKELDKQ